MKRRALSLALTLILCLALAVPALAVSASPVQYAALVDGQAQIFDGYQVDDQIYIRLRDVGVILDSFDVEWDGQAISITTGTSYTSYNGTELIVPFEGEQPCAVSPGSIAVDGLPSDLTGILLTDEAGMGYCYFTPADLEAALGIVLEQTDLQDVGFEDEWLTDEEGNDLGDEEFSYDEDYGSDEDYSSDLNDVIDEENSTDEDSGLEENDASEDAPAWVAAYAEKVIALSQENPDLTYSLIYVDEDDVPELVADNRVIPESAADERYSLSLYTYADDQVVTALEQAPYAYDEYGNYKYAPYANVVYFNYSTSPGTQYYEIYRRLGQGGQLEDYYDQSLSVWYFEDLDHDGQPDEDEPYLSDPLYCYGEQEITKDEYEAYQISGDYQTIQGEMTVDEALDVLSAY